MPYGQIHYQEKLGNSNWTLAEAGCFVTADCNLLEKVGIEVAPDALDTFYTDHGVFLYDMTDKANEDLSWWSVTKYDAHVTVAKTGSGGFPDNDLAIVMFRYRSHTGETLTHFCTVHSVADRSIIDSWDGLVKTPAQYEPIYGQPVTWATYINNVPQTVAPAPSAPASAPAAQTTEPKPAPVNPRQIHLPAWVWIWHIYKPGGPYTLPYAMGALDPKLFGGLTYDIVGNPVPNIYLIQTQDFGLAAIYAGPDTPAQFTEGGHGEGESLPVAEVVPAPQPEPAITYARFDGPLHLVTKAGAKRVNFVSGTVVDELAEGTPFTAVGKATLPNNDVFYMNENDFGIADQTQRTPITVGIKTVDLTTALVPATEPSVSVVESPETIHVSVAAETPAEPVEVNVPELPWQHSMKFFMNPMRYIVKEDLDLVDFASGSETSVKAGTPVEICGRFEFGGKLYYRATSGLSKKTWFGFPVASLVKEDAQHTPFNTHDDINQLGDEVVALSKAKHVGIKAGATAQGFLSRFHKK